ncbi:MAG: hypothetical protein RMK01_02615 [Thermomicrobium sp.]|nr:hypothetical protein [Thermomicrobium sp.]
MVYDRAPEVGTSLVNVATGERRWIARWFGTPAGDRIAVFDPLAAATRIVDWYGRVEAELATGAGAVASSPDGRRLAWLEVADERLPSSAIGRLATVVVYDTVEQRTYRLGQLRVGAVAWSGDGAHLVLIAETADGAQAGIWAAEAPWTQFRWIASGRFFVNLQPVPYSTEVVVTRVLSGEATQDGVWLIDAVDGTARALAIAPSYRVADGTIVVLDDPERALLQVYRLDDLRPCGSTHLTEPVAVDTWDVAPDGQWIAYWSAASQRVLVERLPTCEVAD